MAENFRECFVGEKGYDALKTLLKNGSEFCTEMAYCFQERSEIERAHARALRKNSEAMEKVANRTKGTLSNAFLLLAAQTNKESEMHKEMANIILNDIFMPMKSLADQQNRERRVIDDTIQAKYKEWNDEKSNDNRYRSKQFEKSDEIEGLYLKLNELSTTRRYGKDTPKGNASAPLVMSCVMPTGRTSSPSEKSPSTFDDKNQSYIEQQIKKAKEELLSIEKKYHSATKSVELTRQSYATELSRSCDKAQNMELQRITEMKRLSEIFINSFETFTKNMNDISHDLQTIRITPVDDIVFQARSNSQPYELEILLYDIYAETQDVMNEERRSESLKRWIDSLARHIRIQQQSDNESVQKSVENNSTDDDDNESSSSSDGAMCSKKSKTGYDASNRDGSMCLSSDDGAMRPGKDKKHDARNSAGIYRSSNELRIDGPCVPLLQCLYEASLFKIQSVYNSLNRLPRVQYEYSNYYAKTYNDKGHEKTFIRIPLKSSIQTPPSAPPATRSFAEAMPLFIQPPMSQPRVVQSRQSQGPPLGWAINNVEIRHSPSANNIISSRNRLQSNKNAHHSLTKTTRQVYPDLPAQVHAMPQHNETRFVKAIYSYNATRPDELTIEEGDVILLLERRPDQWCKGNLDGKIGLFPGTFVTDI